MIVPLHGVGSSRRERARLRPPGAAPRGRSGARWSGFRFPSDGLLARRGCGAREQSSPRVATSAVETVKAIEDAVLQASSAPFDDDATLTVLAPVDAPTP